MRGHFVIYLIVLPLGISAGFSYGSLGPNPSIPFWKARTELFRQVEQDRAVLVSVKRTHSDSPWEFVGGGHVQADWETSWQVARHYEQLARLKWLFKKVEYDLKASRLSLMLYFIGFERSMVVEIREVKASGQGILDFHIVDGFFRGLRGRLEFLPRSALVTEVSFEANFPGKVSIPGFLFIPGSEAVMRYVALELRTLIEQAQKNKSKGG